MQLEGIHHITAITGDAAANVEFYAGVLGLRLVKKTVNQDDPGVYHLFYADEKGSPGSDLTFFEYPNASKGSAGAGMVHRICWRVGSEEALTFWEKRLHEHGREPQRTQAGLLFSDPEGLSHQLSVSDSTDPPLRAQAPDIPFEMALLGFDGVRAYASSPAASASTLKDVLGLVSREGSDTTWRLDGGKRSGFYAYDPAPPQRARQGAGTVHHVAFASEIDDHDAWRAKIASAGLRPTPVIDRFYFHSVYFREPSGVLMEIATLGPGFAVDEDSEHLGERLSLPPAYESLRERVESILTPLPNPRASKVTPLAGGLRR